jgi:hypothetical protein
MPSVSGTSKSTIQDKNLSQKRSFIPPFFHLSRNVYILLLFTTGKGFQLSISTLTLNYYVHSLVLQRDFWGYTERKSFPGGGTRCLLCSMSPPTSRLLRAD